MGRSVYKNITGFDGVTQFLQDMPKEMVAEILAGATSKAADIVLPAMKRYARRSVRTGALYASLGKITKSYKHTGGAVSLVGPQRGYFGRGGRKIGEGESRQKAESPSHYAHLIEFGHAQAAGAGWVAPRPFVRPAYLSTRNQVKRVMVEEIRRGIERVRAKAIKEGRHAA